jgi:hypothetical protein
MVGRYFFDTEFLDLPSAGFKIEFISLGIVSEDGKAEFYGVNEAIEEDKIGAASPWVKENVLAKLPPRAEWTSVEAIRQGILDTIAPVKTVEFWASNGSYDNVLLCQIFGGMGNLRKILKEEKGVEKVVFRDMNELSRAYGHAKIPSQAEATKHIAIDDAKQDRQEFEWYIAHMLKLRPQSKTKSPRP